MEMATALVAGIGVVLYLVFVLAGVAMLLSLPVIGLASGAEQVYRAGWRGVRAGTPLA